LGRINRRICSAWFCYAWLFQLAPLRLALFRLAPFRLAPFRLAIFRLAPFRLALFRLACSDWLGSRSHLSILGLCMTDCSDLKRINLKKLKATGN
jgi:hypothetical protein